VVKLFAKLFGQKKDKTVPNPASQMADGITTMPLSDKQVSSIIHNLNQHFDTQQLIVGIGQSVGKQREHNEDSLLAITSTISGNSGNVPFGIYIVADGMGGHQYGEVASNSAIRVIAGDIMRTFHSYLFNLPWAVSSPTGKEKMQRRISYICQGRAGTG
jgi:hypothetical protein